MITLITVENGVRRFFICPNIVLWSTFNPNGNWVKDHLTRVIHPLVVIIKNDDDQGSTNLFF